MHFDTVLTNKKNKIIIGLIGLSLGVVLWLALSLFMPAKTQAAISLNPYPNDSWIPYSIRASFEGCDSQPRTPGVNAWIGLRDFPAVTSVEVEEGTTSIDLRYVFAAAICRPATVTGTLNLIIRTSPGAEELNGRANGITFGADRVRPGAYRDVSEVFTYRPPGGFTETANHTVTIWYKSINGWTSGAFGCVGEPGREFPVPNALSFGRCDEVRADFNFRVVVKQREPTVRVDNAGNCRLIQGWGFDEDFPNQPLLVDTYMDAPAGAPGSTPIPRVIANSPSPDVNQAYPITGNSPHRFTLDYTPYVDMANSPPRTFYVYFIDYDRNGQPRRWEMRMITIDIPSCANTFDLDASGAPDLVPDNESPTQVRYRDVGIGPEIRTIRGVTISRKYTFIRYGQAPIDLNSPADLTNQTISNTTGLRFTPDDTRNLPAVNAGDRVCLTVTMTPGSGRVDGSGNIISAGGAKTYSPACETVVNKPFISAYGGDISVGSGFQTAAGCTATAGEIRAFNRGGTAYKGSGAQLAVRALGSISGFASAKYRGSNPMSPKGLTQANSTADTWGGNFGQTDCIPDYFSRMGNVASSGSGPINLNTLNSGTYYYEQGAQPITISGNLADSKRVNIFVLGDLEVAGNIGYANTNWDKLSKIPSLHIFVKGNIYVNNNVTDIVGAYVAQPNPTNTGGTIFTCARPGGQAYSNDQLWGNCNSKLTVRGSFTGQKVDFRRVAGSLRDDSNTGPNANAGSEVFNFTPEQWLVRPEVLENEGIEAGKLDSLTNLPPLL
jgi:hypothetical protein